MSLEWLPIFFSFFETVKPFVFVGTRKKLQPCAPASGFVFTSSVTKSARRAVGDERLGAVDDVVVAVLLRATVWIAGDVAARVRLAHAERGDLLALDRRGEKLRDLLLRPEVG